MNFPCFFSVSNKIISDSYLLVILTVCQKYLAYLQMAHQSFAQTAQKRQSFLGEWVTPEFLTALATQRLDRELQTQNEPNLLCLT